MPSSLATLLFGAFSLWLFLRDAKRSKAVSSGVWIPVVWACIIASKPVSQWLGMSTSEGGDGYPQDSLLDKALFLFLIGAGWTVLTRRRVNWQKIFRANKWLFVFFAYLGLSIAWADDPFVAFKRWIKDVGNIIMVLVLATDKDPIAAIRAFFARCAYLLIPLSVLVTKYYPQFSRGYDRWTYQAYIVGITTNKNVFGMTLFICALGLWWMFLDHRDATRKRKDHLTGALYLVLLLLTMWLLKLAHSSTASVCTVIGSAVILAMRFPAVRAKVDRIGLYTVAIAVAVFVMQMTGLWDMLIVEFAHIAGRDPSFHGRTDIWAALLKEEINPLLGTGYYSFWSVERAQKLSERYYYTLNEAHNAYLETYLNSGIIGLVLILIVLIAAVKKVKRGVVSGSTYSALCLAFLITTLFYAISEAIFNRLSLMWFVIIMVIVDYPRAKATAPARVEAGEFSTATGPGAGSPLSGAPAGPSAT
jgi:exopolysaccharide production protein ExoQ